MSSTGDNEDLQKLCKSLTGQTDCYDALDTGNLRKIARLVRSGTPVHEIAEQVGLEVNSVRVIMAFLRES